MTNQPASDTHSRLSHPVPGEFLEVRNLLWASFDGEREDPIVFFQLRNTTLGLNLRNIAEIVVTCRDEAFGVENLYKDGRFDPNMLVMSARSLHATLQAWHEAKSVN